MLNSKVKSIRIIGSSKNVTLSFKNEFNGLHFNEYEHVEIENLSIHGNLDIINCTNTNIVNINLYGVLKSDNLNEYQLTISNMNYKKLQKRMSKNGILIHGGINVIDNSKIYGSTTISESIIKIFNLNNKSELSNNKIKVYIKNSYFSGEFVNCILEGSYINLKIEDSKFKNGFTFNNGGALNINDSFITIRNTSFFNNFSNMGGSFYFKNNKFDAQNLYISNSTSIYYGSIFYVEDRNKNYHSSIENIEVRNIKRTISSDNSGIIAFLIGDVNLVIENFIGSNYKCWKKANCILFSLVNGAFLNLINSKFDDAVIFNEGPFFLKLDSDNLHYPRAHIKNIELTNINHFAEKSSSGLGWIENGELIVENVTFKNYTGNKNSVIYSTNNSMVKISNSFFENINTGVTEGIFVSIYSGLTMDNVTVINSKFNGAILNISPMPVTITNSKFDNIQYSNTDENSNLSVIVNKISNSGSLMIANTTFSNLNRCMIKNYH
jgi:hypothetical protein